ncbi:MAG: hypothetical protein J6V58_02715 [Clostridia bacterium]|nr:hypothetical protein [Clostridia bacterium]
MWKDLYVSGEMVSDNGIIIKDEEYMESCRITLEKCSKYYAITCGVYGTMVHTAFCSAEDCDDVYEKMKMELQEFIDSDLTDDEECEFYENFVMKY